MNAKIAITGASGFLGAHMLRALREEGIPAAILSRADLASAKAVARGAQGCAQILHIAGLVNGSADDLQEANTRLMQRVVEGTRKAGAAKIIYVSSAAAAFRNGPYGQSKWEAEEILKSSGIPYLVFRPTLLYGRGDSKNVATMMATIRRLPAIPLLGNGAALIQPLYVEDFVDALLRALASPLRDHVYSVAGPCQISLKDMIVTLASALGKRPWLVPIPLKPVQMLVRIWARVFPGTKLPVKQILELHQHRAFDIAEAKRDFGFSPRPFADGVRALVANGSPAPCAA